MAQNVTARCSDYSGHQSTRLPLTVGNDAEGAFRVVDAVWIDGSGISRMRPLKQLRSLLSDWDGWLPDPSTWQAAQEQGWFGAGSVSKLSKAKRHERRPVHWRINWSRRSSGALGHFLLSFEPDSGDLNQTLWRGMQGTGGRAILSDVGSTSR
jgi:hypothetical protein